MTPTEPAILEHRSSPREMLLIAALSLACACVLQQSPLYTSNQNTYFLPGLAAAGVGQLSSDWLAQQTDAVPLFSLLVEGVTRYLSPAVFYLLHGLLVMVHAASLLVLARRVLSSSAENVRRFVLLLTGTVLFVLHGIDLFAIEMLPGSVKWTMHSAASILTHGLADQSIPGPYLQPSAFGVLLVASLAAFVERRTVLAALLAALAASMHTSLALHASIMVIAFAWVEHGSRGVRSATALAGLFVLAALPMMTYMLQHFILPISPATAAEGARISAVVRQPHHALPLTWFGLPDVLRIGVVAAGMFAVRRDVRMMPILVIVAATVLLLSGVQIATGSHVLALLFPWRSSVWLLPVASAILLAHMCVRVAGIGRGLVRVRWLTVFQTGVVLFVGAAGIAGFVYNARMVRDNAGKVHGGAWTSERRTYLIPDQLQDFRLSSRMPVFVDYKSFPYRYDEIIVWYDRIKLERTFFESTTVDDGAVALRRIVATGAVTHVVIDDAHTSLRVRAAAAPVFENEHYTIYHVNAFLTDATVPERSVDTHVRQ